MTALALRPAALESRRVTHYYLTTPLQLSHRGALSEKIWKQSRLRDSVPGFIS